MKIGKIRAVLFTSITFLLLVACVQFPTTESFYPVGVTDVPRDQAFYRCRAEAGRIMNQPGLVIPVLESIQYMEDCMRGYGYTKRTS